jgi:hypothetical protein
MNITEALMDQSSSMHALSMLGMRSGAVSSHARKHGSVNKEVVNGPEQSGTYRKSS